MSANGDPARFASWELPVLADAAGHVGPLAGVAAAMAWAVGLGASAVLTVPGDTPFIPIDLAARLGAAPAWAESDGAVHPLVALWPTEACGRLAAWLRDGGDLRVKSFGAALGMRTVRFADAPDPFFNINTPAELEGRAGPRGCPSPAIARTPCSRARPLRAPNHDVSRSHHVPLCPRGPAGDR